MSGGGKPAAGPTISASIPPGSKKMVQSIREIVSCPEAEIYFMLKECNMDPSETVHRLLNQDTFHEVKSKREKKKETKDIPESRSRAVNNNSSCGARGGTDRGVRISSTQISSNDYGVPHAKLAHKKENEENNVPPSFTVVSSAAVNNLNLRSPVLCEVAYMENTKEASGTTIGLSLPSQPSPKFQHTWSRAPGQMSMADIVKMGRPPGKPSSTATVVNDTFHPLHDPMSSNVSDYCYAKCSPIIIPPSESESDPDFHTLQDPISHVEEISHDLGTGLRGSHEDCSLVDKMPAEIGSGYPASSIYADPSISSDLLADEDKLHLSPNAAENQIMEGHFNGESLSTESIRATPLAGVLEVDTFGHSSHSEDGMLSGTNSYDSQMHSFERHEVGDVNEISSAAANLQQLSLRNTEIGASPVEDKPAVIIPNHLQVTNADCSHLSFGSFGSGVNATFSVPDSEDDLSFEHSHSRNPEYYDNDHLESSLNENVASISNTSMRSYDMPSASQPEIVRDDTLDASRRIEGNFPSVSGYAYPATTQQTAAAYAFSESNLQMQNHSPFSSLMQPYANSLPSSLLAQSAQPLRELDHPLSALLTTQSMPTRYSTAMSSISGPTISLPEIKPEIYSTLQPNLQTNIPTGGGPALPQHLMHSYSQPTLPLGHFANMVSYPYLPQSYTFFPSAAFQQAYGGAGPFHQSQAAAMKYSLPQYKSSIPVTSLSTPALPGYRGFSSSTNNIPGSFSLNSSTAANTTPGLDEAMSSLYKDDSQYLPHQQNDNSAAMWVHGAGSRAAVSTLPASSFYGFQGQQNQHNGGYRQAQQQASPYGAMGYMNLYQSQGGPTQTQEQQHPQNPSEGSLSGPTSQQIWQNGY